MADQNWVTLITVQGELQAELMRGLLQAQGIPIELSEEGVARVYGLNVGPLASVDLLVPQDKLSEAKQVIADFEAGKFEDLGNQMDEKGEAS